MLLIVTNHSSIGSALFVLSRKEEHHYTALAASSPPYPCFTLFAVAMTEEAINAQPTLFGDTDKIKTLRKC